jgi:colicin import membrane protein
MNTALQISHPQNLDAMLRLTDAHLFTPEMLTRALDLLADVAGPLVADVAEEQGRREINRITRAVGGAITRLDERRRAYVAALKAQPKAIDDLFRVTFRQPAEALKEQVRAPLTAWEEDMRAADDETTRLVELLNAPVASGTTAAAIRQRLDAARELALPDWLSATQRGAIVAAMERNLPRLEAALEAASRAEAQAAELARLRAVARDAELLAARTVAAEEVTRAAHAQQAAREEQIRQEAAATARAAILAEVAQQRAPAPTQATAPTPTAAPATPIPPPEREDRALIHRAILADLEDLGIPSETAKRLISAIARGQVFHLSITY